MSKHDVHFSSKKQDWQTPKDFFDKYNKIYKFKIDLACTLSNCLCPEGLHHDLGVDALAIDWAVELSGNAGWLNPPYGKELKYWVQKAAVEAEDGAKIVMLIPARTDTKYFHEYIYNNPRASIEFIKGRLKFSNAKNAAPFPSMVVVFNKEEK